jgi:multiple sugar transport system substrate-binding protein
VATGAAAILTAALLTTGCASSTRPPNISAPGFGTNAQGVVHFWDRNTTSPLGKLIVQQFNASHKHLKVRLDPIQDTQYVTKLATAVRSGSVPDVVGIDDINSQLFIHSGSFVDLTPLVKALPFKDQFSPGALKLTTDHGHYYGTPYVADLSMLWYNKTLFRRAGLNPNRPPKNYADILRDARKISSLGHGIAGLSFPGDCEGCLGFTILPDIWATGQHLIEGTVGQQHAHISGNAPLRKTLTLYHKLWAEGLSAPTSRTETGATWGQDFLTGKVGMLPAGYGTVAANATKQFLKQVGATPLPGPQGGYSTFDGGANFGIPKGAKNPSGAWEFIKFALRKKEQLLAPTVGFTPIRQDVLTKSYRKKYPFDAVVLGALPKGYAPKTLAYNTTFNQPGGPWLTMFTVAVFDGQVDAAIKAAQPGFTNALQQAQE